MRLVAAVDDGTSNWRLRRLYRPFTRPDHGRPPASCPGLGFIGRGRRRHTVILSISLCCLFHTSYCAAFNPAGHQPERSTPTAQSAAFGLWLRPIDASAKTSITSTGTKRAEDPVPVSKTCITPAHSVFFSMQMALHTASPQTFLQMCIPNKAPHPACELSPAARKLSIRRGSLFQFHYHIPKAKGEQI